MRALAAKLSLSIVATLLLGFFIADYFCHILIFRYWIVSDELTSEEIRTISNSVGSLTCPGKTVGGVDQGMIAGSGTYLLLEPRQENRQLQLKVFITNEHVAQLHDDEESYLNHCGVDFSVDGTIKFNPGNPQIITPGFHYDSDSVRRGEIVDLAVLVPDKIENLDLYLTDEQQETGAITKENIKSELESHLLHDEGKQVPVCNIRNPIGRKVYIFGYPSSSETELLDIDKPRWQAYMQYRSGRHLVVTEGIISGKERDNFFTTALTDTGSSGGLAVLKVDNRPCLFGIPTWGTIGDFTTLGVIQPFQAVFNSGFDWGKM